MMLAEATGNAHVVVRYHLELGHIELLFTLNHLVVLVRTLATPDPNVV